MLSLPFEIGINLNQVNDIRLHACYTTFDALNSRQNAAAAAAAPASVNIIYHLADDDSHYYRWMARV